LPKFPIALKNPALFFNYRVFNYSFSTTTSSPTQPHRLLHSPPLSLFFWSTPPRSKKVLAKLEVKERGTSDLGILWHLFSLFSLWKWDGKQFYGSGGKQFNVYFRVSSFGTEMRGLVSVSMLWYFCADSTWSCFSHLSIAPALIAGNSIVLKPSTQVL